MQAYKYLAQKAKIMFVMIIYIISLLSSVNIVTATDILHPEKEIMQPLSIEDNDEDYLELRAVKVEDIEGKNKQVIMELWSNNINFERV